MQQFWGRHNNSDDTAAMVTVDLQDLGVERSGSSVQKEVIRGINYLELFNGAGNNRGRLIGTFDPGVKNVARGETACFSFKKRAFCSISLGTLVSVKMTSNLSRFF